VNDRTSPAGGSAAIRCVCVQFVAKCWPHSHYAVVPRVGMVAQSMRLLSHVLRRAPNRGRHVLVVVAGEPLNSSGPPVVPTSLRDRVASEVEKLAGSVGCAAGPRRRDFIDLDPDTGLEVGRSGWKSQLVQAHYLRATVETLSSKLASNISDQIWHDWISPTVDYIKLCQPARPRLGPCIGDSLPVTAATTFAISQPPNVIPPGPRLG
jgi:hypothetical protein